MIWMRKETCISAVTSDPISSAIDAEGNTLVKIDSFSSDYYWAYGLQVEGAYATVSMEGTPSGAGYAEFRVNLGDYSYEMSGEEQESQGQTGSAEGTLEEICRRVGEYYNSGDRQWFFLCRI